MLLTEFLLVVRHLPTLYTLSHGARIILKLQNSAKLILLEPQDLVKKAEGFLQLLFVNFVGYFCTIDNVLEISLVSQRNTYS